jgi:hypothetical protein
MYKGTLSSIFDNTFKYNIKIKDLPFGIITKIKNEVYVFTDQGIRKVNIDIEQEQEILYIKTSQVNMIIEVDQMKVKATLKNVIIKKGDDGYNLSYENLNFY